MQSIYTRKAVAFAMLIAVSALCSLAEAGAPKPIHLKATGPRKLMQVSDDWETAEQRGAPVVDGVLQLGYRGNSYLESGQAQRSVSSSLDNRAYRCSELWSPECDATWNRWQSPILAGGGIGGYGGFGPYGGMWGGGWGGRYFGRRRWV